MMTDLHGPEPALQIRTLASDIAREAELLHGIAHDNPYKRVFAEQLAEKVAILGIWIDQWTEAP